MHSLAHDYPDAPRLLALQRTKREFPRLPVLMLTEQHCESLAVWAFRTGVRDFMVKPLRGRDMAAHFQRLMEQLPRLDISAGRRNCLPEQPIPVEARCTHTVLRKATQSAVRFIETHLHEKISLDEMARLCGIGPSQFSRLFKREHGVNFQDYLARKRIDKARELLGNPNATIAEVAHTVGFSDPPYFARVFRSLVGVSPSTYRRA